MLTALRRLRVPTTGGGRRSSTTSVPASPARAKPSGSHCSPSQATGRTCSPSPSGAATRSTTGIGLGHRGGVQLAFEHEHVRAGARAAGGDELERPAVLGIVEQERGRRAAADARGRSRRARPARAVAPASAGWPSSTTPGASSTPVTPTANAPAGRRTVRPELDRGPVRHPLRRDRRTEVACGDAPQEPVQGALDRRRLRAGSHRRQLEILLGQRRHVDRLGADDQLQQVLELGVPARGERVRDRHRDRLVAERPHLLARVEPHAVAREQAEHDRVGLRQVEQRAPQPLVGGVAQLDPDERIAVRRAVGDREVAVLGLQRRQRAGVVQGELDRVGGQAADGVAQLARAASSGRSAPAAARPRRRRRRRPRPAGPSRRMRRPSTSSAASGSSATYSEPASAERTGSLSIRTPSRGSGRPTISAG